MQNIIDELLDKPCYVFDIEYYLLNSDRHN